MVVSRLPDRHNLTFLSQCTYRSKPSDFVHLMFEMPTEVCTNFCKLGKFPLPGLGLVLKPTPPSHSSMYAGLGSLVRLGAWEAGGWEAGGWELRLSND